MSIEPAGVTPDGAASGGRLTQKAFPETLEAPTGPANDRTGQAGLWPDPIHLAPEAAARLGVLARALLAKAAAAGRALETSCGDIRDEGRLDAALAVVGGALLPPGAASRAGGALDLEAELEIFQLREPVFADRAAVYVALSVTNQLLERTFPVDSDALVTEGGGQVANLGGPAVRKILARHGIMIPVAKEGARTNRGAIRQMKRYVGFLNDLSGVGTIDLSRAERWWAGEANTLAAAAPMQISVNCKNADDEFIRRVLDEARKRERSAGAGRIRGAVAQHLVGAALESIHGAVTHHGSNENDVARQGDFEIEDLVYHVTLSWKDDLLVKCAENLHRGLRPTVVVTRRNISAAIGDLKDAGQLETVTVRTIEELVTAPLMLASARTGEGWRLALKRLVERYNAIVREHEAGDRGLEIELDFSGKTRRGKGAGARPTGGAAVQMELI